MNRSLSSKFAPWLLVLLVAVLYLPGTATLPIIDRDEPRFASATREMIERHDWVIPTFNGNYRFDKPVLTYWLMRAGYAVAGVGELGARLHSVAAALALVLLTWRIGRRWFSDQVGWAAAAMLATCLQMLIHGRLALADMPMVACVAVAQYALFELLVPEHEGKTARPWWWLLYLSTGLGFLAKGPIMLAVPVVSTVLFRWVFWRQPLRWRQLRLGPGLLLALVIMAAWGIPALLETHGLFWKVGMGEHVVQRGYEKFNGRSYSPFFYLGTAPVSLFPWVALIGVVVWTARARSNERNAWLLSWLIAPYLIFTAYATQLPHYVLPAFPAFFLLVGQGMFEPSWPRWVKITAWALAGTEAMVVVALLILTLGVDVPTAVEPLRLGLLGAAMLLGGLFLFLALAARRILCVALAGVALCAWGTVKMARGLRAVNPSAHFAEMWRQLPAGTRMIGFGYSEPSAVFYAGGKRWIFPESWAEVQTEVEKPGELVFVTVLNEEDPLEFFKEGLYAKLGREYTPRIRDIEEDPGQRALDKSTRGPEWERSEFAGFNLGRSRWQTVRVLHRK